MLSLTRSLVNVCSSACLKWLRLSSRNTHTHFFTFPEKHHLSSHYSVFFPFSIFPKHSVFPPGLLSLRPHAVYQSSVFRMLYFASPPSFGYLSVEEFSLLHNPFTISFPSFSPFLFLQDHLQNSEALSSAKGAPILSEKGLMVLDHSSKKADRP